MDFQSIVPELGEVIVHLKGPAKRLGKNPGIKKPCRGTVFQALTLARI